MSKAAPPTERLDSSVRERLLQAAVDLFAEKGYAATSVREIVAAAGVTKPVLYYYFQSKEGIYLEIMTSTSGRFLANLDEMAPAQGGVWDRLRSLAESAYAFYLENIKTMKIMHAIMFGPPQGAPFVDFNAVYWRFHQTVEDLVAEGIGAREMLPGDPARITWALMGPVHLAMQVALCQPDRALDLAGLREVLEVTHRAFWAPAKINQEGMPS